MDQVKVPKEPKQHVCLCCSYTTPYISHMRTHLNKVRVCTYETDPNYVKMCEKYLAKKPPKDPTQKDEFPCERCNKTYKSRSAFSRHKHTCKKKITVTVETIEKLESEIATLKEQFAQRQFNQSNINNSFNTVTNININVFGQESLNHLTPRFLDQCVRRRDKGHIELIGHIRKPPENNTVRPSKQPNRLLVYNGESFEPRMKNHTYNDMIDQSHKIMDTHYNTNKERLIKEWSESWKQQIVAYMNDVKIKKVSIISKLHNELDILFDIIESS